jgi:hypothetical protein
MRLYGAIQKVEPQDDGTVRVYGIATSEAVDEQGEIVRADAIRAAIPEYMRFPALREMHQLSAAGTTLEAEVGEDGTTRVVAHVVDPVAVSKVRNQVYRGFSIGGRITQREAGNPKTITGLVLTEISLVDRPANPEAIFDCWKAAIASVASRHVLEQVVTTDSPEASEWASSAQEPFNAPIQIWSCGVSAHRHLAKAEALKCMKVNAGALRAVTAYDEEAASEAVSHQRSNAPVFDQRDVSPSEDHERNVRVSLAKGIGDAGQIARAIAEIRRLREALEPAAPTGNDQSAPSPQMREIIGELCYLLSSLAPPEVGDTKGEVQTSDSEPGSAVFEVRGTGEPDRKRVSASPKLGDTDLPMPDTDLVKAKYSRADQALLDMAHFACDECLKIGGLSSDEKANMDAAIDQLRRAGAMSGALWTEGDAEDADGPSVASNCPALDGADVEVVEAPDAAVERVGKRDRAHQNLMDLAHECLKALTDGGVCSRAAKVGARHSAETVELLKASHAHLLAAGARCDRPGAAASCPPVQLVPETEMGMAAKSNTTAGEQSEKALLTKVLGEIVPMIERLSKRVDEIARTPLPPLTIAKGTMAISKQQDRESCLAGGESELSQEVIAAALGKMSKEEQTLTLIKASYAAPIRIPGSAADPQ